MSTARDLSECRRFERWLMAYVDDELDAVHVLEVEDHLAECGVCREDAQLLRATRCSLRKVTRMAAPSALRERVAGVLAAQERASSVDGVTRDTSDLEEEPAQAQEAADGGGARLVPLRYAMPVAAAALFAIVFGALQFRAKQSGTLAANPTGSPKVTAASLDSLIDDLVSQHAHPRPPETTDPDELVRFDPYIGVRVRRPAFKREVHWIGARMHDRAAMMQYRTRDHRRFTIYVFDPRKVPVRGKHFKHFKRRHIHKRDVLVGKVRGYTVAAAEADGVGYAMASDLGHDESAQLLVTAAR